MDVENVDKETFGKLILEAQAETIVTGLEGKLDRRHRDNYQRWLKWYGPRAERELELPAGLFNEMIVWELYAARCLFEWLDPFYHDEVDAWFRALTPRQRRDLCDTERRTMRSEHEDNPAVSCYLPDVMDRAYHKRGQDRRAA